jgi:hypothetical protein
MKVLFATLSLNDTEHNNNLYRVPLCRMSLRCVVMLSVVMLTVSRFIYCYVDCHCAWYRYAECRGAHNGKLS